MPLNWHLAYASCGGGDDDFECARIFCACVRACACVPRPAATRTRNSEQRFVEGRHQPEALSRLCGVWERLCVPCVRLFFGMLL